MNFILKSKGLILFYLVIACFTYALILRIEKLEESHEYIHKNALVINLW